MHRDFIKCNPTNTCHYEYPKFETQSYDEGCHPCEVKKFLKRPDPEKYVIFYTRHTDYSRKSENKVVGYFKVGKEDYFKWKPAKPAKRGFYSSESVLLSKNDCIQIDYKSRGVPVSWGSSSIKLKITGILNDLQRMKNDDELNIYKRYEIETQRIMELLLNQSGREKIYNECLCNCFEQKCFFSKKLRKEKSDYLGNLYREYIENSDKESNNFCSKKKC